MTIWFRRLFVRSAGSLLIFVLICAAGNTAIDAANAPNVELGAAGFVQTPAHPFGFRGDGTGCFPGGTRRRPNGRE